jgi:hypothetical protein
MAIPLDALDKIDWAQTEVVGMPHFDFDPERTATRGQVRELLERAIDNLPTSFRVVRSGRSARADKRSGRPFTSWFIFNALKHLGAELSGDRESCRDGDGSWTRALRIGGRLCGSGHCTSTGYESYSFNSARACRQA